MKKDKIVAIVGTTASGKSSLGIELADYYGGEIVSADSRQVYRHLDLGTGKVTEEEMARVKHHLIDILDLGEPFSMAQYQTLAYEALDSVLSRGKLPFLVGGTGLYTRCVTDGYNLVDAPPNERLRSELAEKTDSELRDILASYGVREVAAEASARRMIRMIEKLAAGFPAENELNPKYNVLKLGITFDRETLCRRIEQRLDDRIKQGMVEEVERVMTLGATPQFLEGLGLEYRYTYRYLSGQYSSFREYRDTLLCKICQFAKRQTTWFRKEKDILWLDGEKDMFRESRELIDRFINS